MEQLPIVLEFLKWTFIGFEIFSYLKRREKEKALVEALKTINQRLNSLEKTKKT